jgi:hypothetical protein
MNRAKFLESLNVRLDDIEKIASLTNKNAVPFEKLILFIADTFKTGTFCGKINILIQDTEIFSPRTEQESQLNRQYSYLD